MGKKNFWGTSIFGCHSILGVIQFWGPLIFGVKKVVGSKFPGVQSCWGKTNFGNINFWDHSILGAINFGGSKFDGSIQKKRGSQICRGHLI
jgi:hypothetical protein